MKIATTMLCLFAFAVNTALATLGGISYCIKKDINGRVSIGCVQKIPDPCCPDRDTESMPFDQHLIDCDICVDGEIEAGDLLGARAGFDRIAVKAPLATTWNPSAHWLCRPAEHHLEQRTPARDPPVELRASQQYADTVQFSC